MNIEELKKQLNKSLIFECVAMITPMILYVIMLTFTVIVYALAATSDEASAIIVLSLTAVMIIVVIGLLITKIIFTIKAMNSCLDYFTHENDERFIKNTSNSKTSYIIAIILGCFLGSKCAEKTNIDLSWLGGVILILLALLKIF